MVRIGKIQDKEALRKTLDQVLNQLHDTIMNMDIKRATILLHWLNDWSEKFLTIEKQFDPTKLIKYKRGMIVQAHLGFKVGSEQGGLHYCLIVENNNDIRSPIVMVVPLRSLSNGETPEDINKRFEVFVGYGIFENDIRNAERQIRKYEEMQKSPGLDEDQRSMINKALYKLKKKLDSFNKGSVAIVSQMCTLSKLRIYHPKHKGDELYTFRLSQDKLDEIDKVISNLFLKN